MRQVITTYFIVVVLLALGFFGVGALAKAAELSDPMQPPALALQKLRQAKLAGQPAPSPVSALRPEMKPLQLTSILFSQNRKIAIMDDQMLAVGDRIRGARLVKLTRVSARLVRKGKVINLSLDNDLAAIRKKRSRMTYE
jgi:hypothetical protein